MGAIVGKEENARFTLLSAVGYRFARLPDGPSPGAQFDDPRLLALAVAELAKPAQRSLRRSGPALASHLMLRCSRC